MCPVAASPSPDTTRPQPPSQVTRPPSPLPVIAHDVIDQLTNEHLLTAGGASAVELVSLLVQNGLFDSALSLCQTFSLNLSHVFEGLTFK